ncbi:hypothetical protein SULI_13260 [Saccharolobus solfataricus]|uniref:Uncharacterized protein n=3 Tax=Saccharolobus solfataricus TaxID=2287 RepID=Q97XG6_SACS2|nr:hypothetical protein [Saccharolobus solfataricus]AAK41968.1 Hypothetical protein SSO8892 [Saccharolobus solfataricus P2]AKA74709.1 hypothetical protein SULB_2608 [Saccharolobus solfataricus]AKA77404.1 hypothetical protein SULC_2604 [Saccharolobus solfataricus]AKA80095.1 hypothetical protein SULA_2607 [Saccharolobus solfataricus]AZF69174.1 hypothetical protein SULG_13260 [Saccharolobus solfataricus]
MPSKAIFRGKMSKVEEYKIIEHIPANSRTRSIARDAYKETRELYIKIFGNIDTSIWPETPMTCGDSYSGAFVDYDEKKYPEEEYKDPFE